MTGILTYHVVAGNIDAAAVIKAIKKGKGTATLTTLNGGTITARLDGAKVVITDKNGNKSVVVATDLKGSNGIVHVIDTVLLP